MIVDERMSCFIQSLDTGNAPYLEDIYREAVKDGVPVIRRETQMFLRTFLGMMRPERILEVGTAVGFSTLLFCEYSSPGSHITTIENYEPRISRAVRNFKISGKEEQITLLCGDASDILGTLKGSFDLIFMDAAKAQYVTWLPDVLRLLTDGGVLLSDNVLQEGDIIESHFLVERRQRTIYKRMREYLFKITHDPLLTTTVLPVGDGLSISVKRVQDLTKQRNR
ncbi:MAG: O-methyltransferase [Blautia sp.]|nr:O-methyltransferase [Blautia sp.]